MMDLHGKGDNAQHVHCPLFRCSSSARTPNEASPKGEDEGLRSTACQHWCVVPPPGPPARRARRAKARCCGLRRICNLMCVLRQDFLRGEPKVKRLEEIYGVLIYECNFSTRTANEASTKGEGEVK